MVFLGFYKGQYFKHRCGLLVSRIILDPLGSLRVILSPRSDGIPLSSLSGSQLPLKVLSYVHPQKRVWIIYLPGSPPPSLHSSKFMMEDKVSTGSSESSAQGARRRGPSKPHPPTTTNVYSHRIGAKLAADQAKQLFNNGTSLKTQKRMEELVNRALQKRARTPK